MFPIQECHLKWWLRSCLLCAIFVLIFSSPGIPSLFAQSTGEVAGVVTDPAGAVVRDATVTFINVETSFRRSVETNDSGQYVVSPIPMGHYLIRASKTGFSTLERSGIELTAANSLRIDLQLKIGSASEQVSVTASAPLLQNENGTVSTLIDSDRIEALPLQSRDFTDLVLLTPGAHTGSASNLGEGGSAYSLRGGSNYSVNGSTAAGNSYLIDGIYNRNLWLNTLIMVPVSDSIQEYRVMTSSFSAEFGESAGAVTQVDTKGGSNDIHGRLWEFFRNEQLDANTYFNNRAGVARPAYRRNEFGGNLGGPILRNKLFYFIDYQGIRFSQPKETVNTIPTQALIQQMLKGDFSGLGTQIYNPYSTTTTGNGTTKRVPFAGNQIPLGMLDPAAMKLLTLVPEPNSPGTTRNFTYDASSVQRTDQFSIRLDQNTGNSDRFFFRYAYDNSNQTVPGAMPPNPNAGIHVGPYFASGGSATTTPILNWSSTFGYTKVLSPRTVLASHFGVVRWNADITPIDNAYNGADAVGIPGINVSKTSGGLPEIAITSYHEWGDDTTYPELSHSTTFQLDSTLTTTRGAHTIKTGLLFLRHRLNGFSAYPANGSFSFNGQYTRQIGTTTTKTALADFMLGVPSSVSRNAMEGLFGMRWWILAPFVQDTWHVANRLTIDAGVRWEAETPPVEVHDRWANLDLNTGIVELAGRDGNSRSLRNFYWGAVSPRVGFAYLLTRDNKTVLRGGFGTSAVYEAFTGRQLYKNPPFFVTQQITTDIDAPPVTTLSQGLPLPDFSQPANPASGSFNPVNKNLRPSQIYQWNLGMQRQLMQNLLLDVAYVGARGEFLLVSPNLNQTVPGPGSQVTRRPFYKINPNFADILYWTGAGDSYYNSLQVKVEKRFSRGLTMTGAYTYGSYLSDVGNPNGGGNSSIQNWSCIGCNRGPTPDAYRHVAVLSHLYQLPFGPHRAWLQHGIVSQIIGDWNLNGIWTLRSGGTFTPTFSSNVSNSTGGGTQRPNRIGSGVLPASKRNIDHWFDSSAFVAPAQYTFGNSGTGILNGPGYFNVDLGLVRQFYVTERFRLDLRGEAFNAFNRANFGNPSASIGSSTAGQISSTSAARIMQVALKLNF